MAQISSKRLSPNYFYVIFSEALLLFLLGLFGLILLKAGTIFKEMRESLDIIVELKNEVGTEAIDQLNLFIKESDFLKPGSFEFISKERGAKILEEEFGKEFILLSLPNPLYDIITFNVQASFMEEEKLKALAKEVERYEAVNQVYYEPSLFTTIADNFQKITLSLAILSLILIVVVIVLIRNTVKLALYANRFLVKNMQLVGASWSFISNPYLRKSIWQGILSALIALIFLGLLIYWLKINLPEINFLSPIQGILALIVLIFALSAGINFASTYFTIKRYLKMRVDDLF